MVTLTKGRVGRCAQSTEYRIKLSIAVQPDGSVLAERDGDGYGLAAPELSCMIGVWEAVRFPRTPDGVTRFNVPYSRRARP
jgi:hypothetical protein